MTISTCLVTIAATWALQALLAGDVGVDLIKPINPL
jgi:hypothetical protein